MGLGELGRADVIVSYVSKKVTMKVKVTVVASINLVALVIKDRVMIPTRIIQTTTPSLCKAYGRMLQLNLWLIISSRLGLLRQMRKLGSL
uniref:Uncharacterized protein n=1 Tax=Peromyscus maniculatus bairdii TaxID=230844 RepID=A0A8C8W225_PERMB